jgi:hypothetical protein
MDLNDRKNIVGISSLIDSDNFQNDKYSISDLEKQIILGANIDVEGIEEENDVIAYQKDLERISTSFGIGTFQEQYHDETEDQNNDELEVGHNTYHEKKDYDYTDLDDKQLHTMTLEQKKQNYVNEALCDIEDLDNDLELDIDAEREDDDKIALLEQIDQLRDSLDDDNVNLSNVKIVTKENSISDIKNIYKILMLKNDRNRYCSFAEEAILSAAFGIEYLFDGKKEWFGRKPDLVGWSSTVKIKLRRCRFQTSSLIKEMMSSYNMGPAWQLALEVIPSLFLYSRNKRISNNDSISSASYDDAISSLNEQNYN